MLLIIKNIASIIKFKANILAVDFSKYMKNVYDATDTAMTIWNEMAKTIHLVLRTCSGFVIDIYLKNEMKRSVLTPVHCKNTVNVTAKLRYQQI